jgi:hypothetical protein
LPLLKAIKTKKVQNKEIAPSALQVVRSDWFLIQYRI